MEFSLCTSWRALASTATRIIERPARRDGERLRGKIAFAELPNGIDDRRLANPTPCGIRKIKTNSFGLITPKAGRSIRLSQSNVVWWTRPGSNRRPPHCERGIAKAKTRRHNHLAF